MCRCMHVYVCMYVCMYICTYVRMYVCTYVCMYVFVNVCMYVCMHVCMYDAGLLHPPPPPPHGIPPLACQVGSLLVWPCCFLRLPGWSCLAVGWGLFGWPRPACGGAVCSTEVILQPLVRSNFIVTCSLLVPH